MQNKINGTLVEGHPKNPCLKVLALIECVFSSGLLNLGFIDEGDNEKQPIESVDTIHTPIHLADGSAISK